jgi:DNA modification methylase
MENSSHGDIVHRPISSLKPNPRNARTHSKRQIRKIASSIDAFGFIGHILIDTEGTIIAGHGRLEAAKLLKMETVPTLCISHLTPEQIRAYMIADNRLAELAGWDDGILAIEFQDLMSPDLQFDVLQTGFEAPQIDMIIMKQRAAEDEEYDDQVIMDEDEPIVSRPDDLWLAEGHRIYCGNALEPESFVHLMQGDVADVVFTDYPYNVKISGNVSGLGKHKHGEFAMGSGEMDDPQFVDFMRTASTRLTENARDGSVHFQCMDWRGADKLQLANKGLYSKLLNVCVWNKDKGGMGALYRSKHEFVFVYKQGDAPHVNNIELGRHGRNRTNVWDYPSANSMMNRDGGMLTKHPTPKPVAMVADAIRDCSNQRDIVLDPFGGGGSTLMAAERTGRIARIMEIEPRYVDVMIRRWAQKTGNQVTLAASGMPFLAVAAARAADAGKEAIHG